MRDTGSHQRIFCMRDTGSHQRVFFMRDNRFSSEEYSV